MNIPEAIAVGAFLVGVPLGLVLWRVCAKLARVRRLLRAFAFGTKAVAGRKGRWQVR